MAIEPRPEPLDGSSAPMRPICVVATSAPRSRIERCARSGARPRLDIPRLEKSSGSLDESRPSDALAIGLAVDQTAVQDADQTICKGPQSLMVSLAAGAQDVVSMSRAFGASQGGECPLVAGVGEPAVARHPRENDLASAGGLGDGRSARIALASLRMQKSGSVITELGHSPGAEDNTESRQTEVDLGVRVLLKTRGQLLLEGCDLLVELFDDCHGGGDTMAIGFNEKRGRLQLGQSQLGLNLNGLCLQISLPAPMAESGDDFCLGEGTSTDRGRGLLQDGNRIGRVQVVERAQGSGVKLTQRVAKLVDLALSRPDQTLMSSGKYLDRLGEVGVSGQRPISMPTTTLEGSSACSAMRACSLPTPSSPSGTLRFASTCPSSLTTQMSWWASAQSIPTKTIGTSSVARMGTEPKESSDELIEQCSRHNIPPVVHLSSPAGGGTV